MIDGIIAKFCFHAVKVKHDDMTDEKTGNLIDIQNETDQNEHADQVEVEIDLK